MELGGQIIDVTGFAPGQWSWGSESANGESANLVITATGVYTLDLLMREDGLRIDRLLLTTDTNFIPTSFGPTETNRQLGSGGLITPLTRTIVYTYDNLYHLTEADYTSGENYQYSYDPVGNRLEQVINGDTSEYLYDAANRLAQLNGQAVYSFDNNGNLLNSDTLTNTFDAANRLTASTRDGTILEPIYNGVNDRVGQVTAGVTTTFALDIAGGLPEVIYTSEGNAYLHLPGVIMAESSTGDVRYLLSDGLGSVRQAVDENGEVVAYNEFDPYGNPVEGGGEPYGSTGEWWQDEVALLHLRARWYAPETGTFLSVDPVESEPPYQYVWGNPVNLTDPSGMCAQFGDDDCWAVYDQIIALCPECAVMMERVLADGRTIKLHQENTQFLRRVLENVKNGWRPSISVAAGLQGANGYVEGRVGIVSAFVCVWQVTGVEVVYDFESRQRQKFIYREARGYEKGLPLIPPGLAFSIAGASEAKYGGFLWGFTGKGVVGDYSGYFVGTSLGVSQSIVKSLGLEGTGAIGWALLAAKLNGQKWPE